jgi:hypothetical protein
MDFVYICRSGDNEELRYSIRSVLNSFSDAIIWVVGGKPDWYCGNYIEVPQDKNTYKNAFNNLNKICNTLEIEDNFILMNDDFFIINKIDSIKYFYGGTLIEKISLYKDLTGSSSYINKLVITFDRLKKYKIQEPLDYELHIPFPMNKNNLSKVLNKNERFLYRSMYGNIFNVGGLNMDDVKVYDRGGLTQKSFDYQNIGTDFLSTTDTSFAILEPMLKQKFSNKSIYEI